MKNVFPKLWKKLSASNAWVKFTNSSFSGKEKGEEPMISCGDLNA
jgi:hypothetical protein